MPAATTEVWAPSHWPIPVGQHFSLTVQVCAPEGQTAPAVLRVDADMPLHKHGMNYRTTLKELGPGRTRAEGLMFHMPGRWRFLFDLTLEDGRTGKGVAAEALGAKWFEKSPEFSDAQNLDQLRQALKIAIEHYTARGFDTPFGFVTTEASPEMRALAEENGAAFLITKPFTAEDFQQHFDEYL